jgi:hypothetical protein
MEEGSNITKFIRETLLRLNPRLAKRMSQFSRYRMVNGLI